jgi:hypothetical protein
MFGSWGGMILQIAITLVVVAIMIGAIYWLVRRYSSGGLGRIGRGRVPRLAVIDAMPVDGRRRLVLVRRDNIEHLLLIGGPTDIVVEPSIQRPRRPVAKPQGATPTAPPANEPVPFEPPTAAESAPIPFPQSRPFPAAAAPAPPPFRPEPQIAQAASAPPYQAPAPTPQPIERPFSPIRRTPAPTPAPASRPEPASQAASMPSSGPTVVQFEPMAEPPLAFPEMQQAPTFEESEAPLHGRRGGETNGHGTEERPLAFDPFSPPQPSAEDTAAKVNDLEREMARLLGEITTRRS